MLHLSDGVRITSNPDMEEAGVTGDHETGLWTEAVKEFFSNMAALFKQSKFLIFDLTFVQHIQYCTYI
jgi:hypothetical protein